jgi:iron complex transport system ATP-binding protein
MTLSIDTLSLKINHKILLRDISLKLPADQLTLVIGPNGAGKSTLLKACSGDMAPTQGSIQLNGRALENYSERELSQRRAVMTQSYQMGFSFTVQEIVSMGCYVYEEILCRQKQQEMIRSVMAFMDIEHLAERQFNSLSGGEQQRTQLARVLTQLWYPYEQEEARYLFLDEPTSSLDIYHQYQLLRLTKALTQRNIGVMAVVHDLSLAATFADQLVLLFNGSVIAQGSPESVLQKQQLYPAYGVNGHYYQHSKHLQPSVLFERVQ